MKYVTLPGMFFSQADAFAGADCLRYQQGGEYLPISWREVESRVLQLVGGLSAACSAMLPNSLPLGIEGFEVEDRPAPFDCLSL